MASLNSRANAILCLLLNADVPLSRSQIAGHLKIPSRVVEYSLRQIRFWLEERNVKLVSGHHYGAFISATDATREALRSEIEEKQLARKNWSAEQRWKILVFHLLTKEGPTIIRELQLDIGVSRPTLINDLNNAEEWLKKFNLKLVRRPGFGIAIQGDEQKIREATLLILLDNLGETYLQSYIEGATKSKEIPITHRFENCAGVTSYLDGLNLWSIARHVRNLEHQPSARFTDNTRKYLTLLLGITTWRLKNNQLIDSFPVDCSEITNVAEYSEAKRMCDQLGHELRITVPEDEIRYLTINLLGAKTVPSTANFDSQQFNEIAITEALTITKDFLSWVSLHLHPMIRIDRRLIQNLAFHIKPVLARLKYALPIRNPLLEEIKSEYPFLFKVAKKGSRIFVEQIGISIPDDEIGYLVMHLAAAMRRLLPDRRTIDRVLLVCGAGMATIWLMVSKINRLFPQFVIKDVLSASEIRNRASYSNYVDLVISTVPLGDLDVPVVHVSPLLNDQDLSRIKTVVDTVRNTNSEPISSVRMGPSLIDLLSLDTIRLNTHAESWPEVVEEAGKTLLSTGAIEKEYITAMKEIIRRHGPYAVVQPGVVLLHARPGEGVNRVCMSLVTLETPVRFGHPNFDPIKVAFVLASTDHFEHIKALEQLAVLLGDRDRISQIQEARSKDIVIKIISEHIAALEDDLYM